MNFAFGSISCLLFLAVSFSTLHPLRFSFNKALILPMTLYVLMVISLLWTRDTASTLAGLKKESLIFLIPLTFLFIPKISKERIYLIFRIYSFSMVFYALYYFINAIFRYLSTGNKSVFFYHELVTLDLSAIYVSAFASFALFYFISIKTKSILERVATLILVILLCLLSSKTIIFIDVLLFVCYYIFFSETHKSIKEVTIFVVSVFLIASLIFVEESRERLMTEYETAFVDNTVNKKVTTDDMKVYNVSLKQALHNERFQENNFFPGMALRIFQTRIFIEMLQEQSIVFTGFGFEASQDKIREKAEEHRLPTGYGEFNFHNQYVQTFAELGIVGFIILLLMMYVNIKNAIDNKSFLHIVFSITMIMLFLSESFLCRQRGVMFFITIYCLFNTINTPKTQEGQ